jgi:hypothetical protein
VSCVKSSFAITDLLGCCALLLFCSFAGSSNSDVQQWRSSDPAYVPFPVEGMAISPDNRFVALSVDEHPRKDGIPAGADALTNYVLDLTTGYHRKVGSGEYKFVPASHGHSFLAYDQFSRSTKPLLFDGLRITRTLDVGDHSGGWWNPHTSSAIFETSWPTDRDGFNGVTIWNESTGNANRVHLHEITELLSFCPVTGHFFTEHWYSNVSGLGTDEYDAHGTFVKGTKQDRAALSARCRYVLPFSALALHGPDDWAIYDATSGAQLQDFPWNEDGKHDLHSFIAWNPVFDHLLLMHSEKASSESGSVDVLDVRHGVVIMSWADSTEGAPMVWSGDGSSVVTIRDHRVIVEKIRSGGLF